MSFSRIVSTVIAFGLALGTAMAAETPRPAPEFEIKLPDGKRLLLSQFRGKVVALEFLFTTCPHCQTTSAAMNKVYKELGPKGFQPLGVAFNEMAGMLVPDYVKELRLDFPVGVGDRDKVLAFLQHSPMLRLMVPQLVLIDRKGIIQVQHVGGHNEQELREAVTKLLAEAGAPKATKGAKVDRSRRTSQSASNPRSGGLQ